VRHADVTSQHRARSQHNQHHAIAAGASCK
jgi:hypothetical protein